MKAAPQKSKRFSNLDFSDRPPGQSSGRFRNLDFQDGFATTKPCKWSLRFHRIGQDDLAGEDPYRLFITKAKESQSHHARVPELRLEVRVPAHTPEIEKDSWGFRWGGTHSHREWLLEHGFWQVVDVDQWGYWAIIGRSGPFALAQRIKPDPEGRHEIKTSRGLVRFSDFRWDNAIIPRHAKRKYVKLAWLYEKHGNVQRAWVEVGAVRKAIADNGLDFEVAESQHGSFSAPYTGQLDKVRETDIYKKWGRGPQWGIRFYSRPNKRARRKEVWGGSAWPDEKSAKAAAKRFVDTGETDFCNTLDHVRVKFPDHPILMPAHQGMTKAQLRDVASVHGINVDRYAGIGEIREKLGISEIVQISA